MAHSPKTAAAPFCSFLFVAASLAALPAQSLVRDLNDAWPGASAFPGHFVGIGDRLFFSAIDGGVVGVEPWSWHPSTGVVLLADIVPGRAGSDPGPFVAVDDSVLFWAGPDGGFKWLYRSDGTPGGTVAASLPPGAVVNPFGGLVSDGRIAAFLLSTSNAWEPWIYRRSTDSYGPIGNFQALGGSAERIVAVDAGRVYVSARTPVHGDALWLWDGVSMRLLASVGTRIDDATVIGGALYFAGHSNQHGIEPWVADAQGVRRLADLEPGTGSSQPRHFVGWNGDVYFMAATQATGAELFVHRPASGTTTIVADVHPGPNSGYAVHAPAVPGRNALLFVGVHPSAGTQLYRSDGTAAGTAMVRQIGSPWSLANEFLTPVCGDGNVLFRADDGVHGRELWISDGSTAGTRMLFDLDPGAGHGGDGSTRGPRERPVRVGDQVLFAGSQPAVGCELFAFPARLAGLACATDLRPGCAGTSGVPGASAVGLPRVGNGAFACELSGARSGAGAFLLVGGAIDRVALGGGCTVFTGLSPIVLAHATDGAGRARAPLPVPNQASLIGAPVRAQWAVADPAGAYFGVLSFSDGLALLIGP